MVMQRDREMVSLRDMMSRLLEESLVPSWAWGPRTEERTWRLPLDVYATDDEIVIQAAVPGLKPEDVEITLEGDTLTIKGEFKAPLENVNYLLQERGYGVFVRTLTLNIPVEADKATARFENGLLTLVLPKAQAVRPRVIKVKSQ
jgi:HSP20 family protein